MERARENEYSLLRVICCAAVVILHTGSIYLAGWTTQLPGLQRTAAGLMQSLTRDAVPLFVMLSGAFLLLDDRNRNPVYFYRKSFWKLGVPTLVFSALYVAYAYAVLMGKIYIKHTAVPDPAQLWEPVRLWLRGVPYFHMWFMYMLIGLYVITPLLVRLRGRLENNLGNRLGNVLYFALGLACLAFGVMQPKAVEPVWYVQWTLYTGYFMLGASIRGHFLKKGGNPMGNAYLAAGLAILAAAAWSFHQALWKGWPGELVIHPLSVPVALSSLLVFAGVAGRRITVDLGAHSGLTFYIYLFHGGVLSFLDILIRNVLRWTSSIFQMLVTAVLTYLVSWGLSVLWTRGVCKRFNKVRTRIKV